MSDNNERHSRKCRICRHPHREEIEQEYREWFKATDIARRYHLDDSALHRHLRAVGLITGRRENLRIVLDHIIGRGAERPVTANEIIRAVRAQTCLTDDNKWVEPAKSVIYLHKETVDRELEQEIADQRFSRAESVEILIEMKRLGSQLSH
jgi:hypothetical protein